MVERVVLCDIHRTLSATTKYTIFLNIMLDFITNTKDIGCTFTRCKFECMYMYIMLYRTLHGCVFVVFAVTKSMD